MKKLIFLNFIFILSAATPVFAYDEVDVLDRLSNIGFEDIYIRIAAGNLLAFIEGAFGALVMVVAGLIALISAITGNYKAALAFVVVAIGAFILRSVVSLFFGTDFPTEGFGLNDYSSLLEEVRYESQLLDYEEGVNTF